jgi:hypothetical protein
MNARITPGSLDGPRAASPAEETRADSPVPGLTPSPSLHSTNPDAYTEAGRSHAARASVAVKAGPEIQATVGLSPLLDTATLLARTGFSTRIMTDDLAKELASHLDATRSGFESRLVHMLVERTVDHALVSSRGRQRLVSSLTQAFSRTGERLSPERPANIDGLGLPRCEQTFGDALFETLLKGGGTVPPSLLAIIKQTKSAPALGAAFDALSKVLNAGVFHRPERVKILSAFLQAQARLRAAVIPMAMLGGAGTMTLQLQNKERRMDAFEADALRARLKHADVSDLESMRQQLIAIIRPPLFAATEARQVLGEVDQRLMLLRAL